MSTFYTGVWEGSPDTPSCQISITTNPARANSPFSHHPGFAIRKATLRNLSRRFSDNEGVLMRKHQKPQASVDAGHLPMPDLKAKTGTSLLARLLHLSLDRLQYPYVFAWRFISRPGLLNTANNGRSVTSQKCAPTRAADVLSDSPSPTTSICSGVTCSC